MRRNLLLAAVLAATIPARAAAQAPAAPPDAGARAETDRLPVAADDGADFGGAPDGEVEDLPAGSADTHVVQPGDTLWGISGRYLQNPWYWPKVWSFNPQIENPHWIYPGDEIRLQPGASGAADGELPEVSRGDLDDVYAGSDDVQLAGRIGARTPGRMLAARVGFVTEEELRASGVLEKSWEEKSLLMEGDRVYIAWSVDAPVEVGSNYVIYRTERSIPHPEGGTVGHLTRILGTARVLDADPRENYVTAVITRSLEEIVRGDRIGPVSDGLSRRVAPAPNEADVSAFILATLEEGAGELGQGHVVFLDRGSTDGVAEGNTFEVIRAGDGLEDDGYTPHFDELLPAERIGSLLVVDVRERTSAALVVRSIRELRVGDRVEMRTAAN